MIHTSNCRSENSHTESRENVVTKSHSARQENHYKNVIMEFSDQKLVFKIVNKLSNSIQNTALSEHVSSLKLANHVGIFFNEKL